MKTISRYIMTLALLITAVGGAWAQGPWTSGDCTVTLSNGTLTVSGKGAMADYESSDKQPWQNNRNDITSVVVESGVTTVGNYVFYYFENLTSVTLPEGLTKIGENAFIRCVKLTSVTIPSTVTSIDRDAFYSCTGVTDVNLYADPANLTWNDGDYDDFKQVGSTKCHVLAEHLSAYQTKFNGKVHVTFVGDLEPLPGTMVLNSDKTVATMTMPASDVTVNYELVRDMAVSMTTKIGDGNDGYRIRLKKSEQDPGKYEPAEMTAQQMKELVKVHDAIENYDLTFGVLGANCIVNIYEANDENQAVGEPIAFADLTPGRYIAKAVAATGSAYEGETDMSNIFVLFEGYEVEVPAGEYITYFKDEALYVEDTEAKLYTITAVSGTTATADELTIAPANTPILVKNNGSETKTILLIPTTEEANNVTVYSGFKGTTEAAKIAASTDSQDNYAFNGKEFVRVTEALDIAANKAWLEVTATTASAAPQIRLIFSSATGIERVDGGQLTVDSWYSLDGRRLPGKPSQKGIYIVNGKKVVIK